MALIICKEVSVPSTGKMLGDYAEGDIVKIPENGSPVEFYVAKHDYESGLNGAGRTLLVRKSFIGSTAWNTMSSNAYSTSYVDSWLNGSYKSRFNKSVQENIDSTSFYYTAGNYATTVTKLSRSVFLPSLKELGKTNSFFNAEGSKLPIAEVIAAAIGSGLYDELWTRSADKTSNNQAGCVNYTGNVSRYDVLSALTVCPMFTLASTTKFDPGTNVIK